MLGALMVALARACPDVDTQTPTSHPPKSEQGFDPKNDAKMIEVLAKWPNPEHPCLEELRSHGWVIRQVYSSPMDDLAQFGGVQYRTDEFKQNRQAS